MPADPLRDDDFGHDPLHHDTPDPWSERRMAGRFMEPKPFKFNRRAGVRRKISIDAVASGYGFGGAVVSPVHLTDASINGIGLNSPVAFEVGTEIELRFNGSERVGRCGLVARCDEAVEGYKVGIEMDAASAAA
ncbi:MAG: PilZ domain-containing protein [Phycisphaerales bacterium]